MSDFQSSAACKLEGVDLVALGVAKLGEIDKIISKGNEQGWGLGRLLKCYLRTAQRAAAASTDNPRDPCEADPKPGNLGLRFRPGNSQYLDPTAPGYLARLAQAYRMAVIEKLSSEVVNIARTPPPHPDKRDSSLCRLDQESSKGFKERAQMAMAEQKNGDASQQSAEPKSTARSDARRAPKPDAQKGGSEKPVAEVQSEVGTRTPSTADATVDAPRTAPAGDRYRPSADSSVLPAAQPPAPVLANGFGSTTSPTASPSQFGALVESPVGETPIETPVPLEPKAGSGKTDSYSGSFSGASNLVEFTFGEARALQAWLRAQQNEWRNQISDGRELSNTASDLAKRGLNMNVDPAILRRLAESQGAELREAVQKYGPLIRREELLAEARRRGIDVSEVLAGTDNGATLTQIVSRLEAKLANPGEAPSAFIKSPDFGKDNGANVNPVLNRIRTESPLLGRSEKLNQELATSVQGILSYVQNMQQAQILSAGELELLQVQLVASRRAFDRQVEALLGPNPLAALQRARAVDTIATPGRPEDGPGSADDLCDLVRFRDLAMAESSRSRLSGTLFSEKTNQRLNMIAGPCSKSRPLASR